MTFLGIVVNLPIIVNVDNIGAIYLANNSSTNQRTRHIDVRYHFVREYVEEGTVKIVFVQSKENIADIFTKNTSAATYLKHSAKFMTELTEEGDIHEDIMTSRNGKGVREANWALLALRD